MHILQLAIGFLGRLCLSSIFIFSALRQSFSWNGALDEFTASLGLHIAHVYDCQWTQDFLNIALKNPSIFLAIILGLKVVGAFCVFTGIRPKLGALALILLFVPITLLNEPFWLYAGSERYYLELAAFMNSIAIFGGLLMVLAFGTGRSPKFKAVFSNVKHTKGASYDETSDASTDRSQD